MAIEALKEVKFKGKIDNPGGYARYLYQGRMKTKCWIQTQN